MEMGRFQENHFLMKNKGKLEYISDQFNQDRLGQQQMRINVDVYWYDLRFSELQILMSRLMGVIWNLLKFPKENVTLLNCHLFGLVISNYWCMCWHMLITIHVQITLAIINFSTIHSRVHHANKILVSF